MTEKKTEAKPAETLATEEHGVDAKGKVNKNLDADGNAIADQDGAAARLATMTPDATREATGQTGTASATKKG